MSPLPNWQRELCSFFSCLKIGAAAVACGLGVSASFAASVDLVPFSTSDGVCVATAVDGQTAYQNTGTSGFFYFRRPSSFAFTPGQTLYVRSTYYDEGGGKISLQYDGQAGAFTSPGVHTRTSRIGTGKYVNGYYELTAVNFARRENGSTDFRLGGGSPGGVPVSMQKVTLSDTPFPDADFQLAVARPWKTRYTGTARDYVDTTTLKGKVMVGYQGWFRTPNDLDDNGWIHWASNNTMTAENFNTDMWPDLTQYDPATLIRAGSVMTRGGAPAYLFSSTSLIAVRTHFRWMRKYNIDGAFVQRFGPQAGAQPEWVLRNVSQAAAEEGVIWAIEYDVSGMTEATVAARLQADWEWLTTQFGILQDPRYAHEGAKPVVFIWGFPFADRGFSTTSANTAVDYFKSQGCYVIGGIPNTWSSLDADWQAHILKYDGVLAWQNQGTSDGATFRGRGQDFYPHIWPGFSWANLQKQPADPPQAYTDRNGGQFYWTMGRNWVRSGGADRLFVGMFDEYDEGTAIMPMSDDPPNPTAEYGRFIDNQGNPSDWWLMLTDELKRMMLKQRSNSNTLPTLASLSNRSNIGAEASVDLGATDVSASLSRVDAADGHTVVETVGGKECRANATPATDLYMYFNVGNPFAYQMNNGDVTVEVEYFDATTNTVLGLQYDSTSAANKTHSRTVTTAGSNEWRRVRFEIADAYFGGRQNGEADFRLTFGGKKVDVNRVWVRLPEGKYYAFTWNNATAGSTLNWSANANWLGGIVAPSDLESAVNFLPSQPLPGGAISIANDLAGARQIGALNLGGTGSLSTATTITLSGNPLNLGGSASAISLVAIKNAGVSYDVSAPLTLTSAITVGGDGDATFRISGAISGSGGLIKTGSSTLTLSGAGSYLGSAILNAGVLVINGSLGGTALTVGSGGVLSGSGTISAPTTIHGLHRPGTPVSTQTFTGSLTYAADGRLKWSLIDNTTSGADTNYDRVSGTSVAANPGAAVDVVLNSSTSAVNFTNALWKTPRSWTVLTASGALTGSFSLGTVSADAGGRSPAAYGAFSLMQTGNALNLIWTPIMTFASWRTANFEADAGNPAIAGENADPDRDGLVNKIEYALGTDPKIPDANGLPASQINAGFLTLTYTRPAGITDLTYQVQWSADLVTWSNAGVTEETILDRGTSRSIRAKVSLDGARQFMRLRVGDQ